jgi:hypothetical protein
LAWLDGDSVSSLARAADRFGVERHVRWSGAHHSAFARRLVLGLICSVGLALVGTGCGADAATGGDASPSAVSRVEPIKERIGKSCEDDNTGVKQSGVTIWCDPKEPGSSTLVWVDAKGHQTAERAKRQAAEKQAREQAAADKAAAAKKSKEQAAARKAKEEAAEEKAKAKAAAERAAKQKAAAEKAKAKAAAERAAEQKAAEARRQEAARRSAAAKAEAERKAAEQQRQQNANVYYKNCDAVRAAGAAPIYRGNPGYAKHLDRDGDGVGCE